MLNLTNKEESLIGRLFKLPSTEFLLITRIVEDYVCYAAFSSTGVSRGDGWKTNDDFIQTLLKYHYEITPIDTDTRYR